MPEKEREYSELCREVVEGRNQSIKTDNQIKNLSLDVKGFENRFDILEKRLRFSQVGVHFIVALAIAAAAYFVASSKTRSLQQELAHATQKASKIQQAAATKSTELDSLISQIEEQKRLKASSQDAFMKVLDYLDQGKKEQAIPLLDKIKVERLSKLEQRFGNFKLEPFRAQVAEESYRKGRDLLARGRRTNAIAAFKHSLHMQASEGYSNSARYLLGINLREGKRYKEAVQVFANIRNTEKDKSVLEEIAYWEGYSLIRLGKAVEAKKLLEDVVKEGGRHARSAQEQLATLSSAAPSPAN